MGYDALPNDETPPYDPSSDSLVFTKKKKKRCGFFCKKSFWICCSNVELGSGALEEKVKNKTEKGKDNFGLKLKKKPLLCCSNVEIQTEEDKAKVLSYLDDSTKMSRVRMCCSSFVVGPKSDLEHGGHK